MFFPLLTKNLRVEISKYSVSFMYVNECGQNIRKHFYYNAIQYNTVIKYGFRISIKLNHLSEFKQKYIIYFPNVKNVYVSISRSLRYTEQM